MKMKAAASVTLAIAVIISAASAPTNYASAAGGAGGSFRAVRVPSGELRGDELKKISKELSSLATPSGVDGVVKDLFGGDVQVDRELLQSGLSVLGHLVGSEEGRELLSKLQNPNDIFKVMAEVDKSSGSEGKLAGLTDFASSMERVLRSNPELGQRVSDLIQSTAEDLTSSKDFARVLRAIASSDVLKDLKEEVEAENASPSSSWETRHDDMSR